MNNVLLQFDPNIPIPTSPTLNLGPASMISPHLPNDFGIPFQVKVQPPPSTGFPQPYPVALSPDLPTHVFDIHRFAVPQTGVKIESPAKDLQGARLSNGGSCRRTHKCNRPYSLEDDRGHLKANKARNEASGQWGTPPSILEHGPIQNRNPLPASGQGRQKAWEDNLIQLLEASPEPMSKKAILQALRNKWGLSDAEWREFKANNTVNRAM